MPSVNGILDIVPIGVILAATLLVVVWMLLVGLSDWKDDDRWWQ